MGRDLYTRPKEFGCFLAFRSASIQALLFFSLHGLPTNHALETFPRHLRKVLTEAYSLSSILEVPMGSHY